MRAAFVRSLGAADRIEFGELPEPNIGPTDILVRFEASEANHVDRFVRSGAYRTHTPFPFVIGRDVVGTVVSTGDGVAHLQPGERVWSNSLGLAGRQGSWSELVAIPADRAYRLPKGVDPQRAAVVLHGAATAYIGLFRRAHLRLGETVFIGGGAGSVGSASIRLASMAGARVIASAAAEDASWCRELGADGVVDYHDSDWMDQVKRIAPDGVDLWWDNSGHHDYARTLPLLRQGGTLVMAAGMASREELPAGALYTRDLSIAGFAISNASIDDLAAAAAVINALLGRDALPSRVARSYTLAQARKAHQALESEHLKGRVLILP